MNIIEDDIPPTLTELQRIAFLQYKDLRVRKCPVCKEGYVVPWISDDESCLFGELCDKDGCGASWLDDIPRKIPRR